MNPQPGISIGIGMNVQSGIGIGMVVSVEHYFLNYTLNQKTSFTKVVQFGMLF